MKNLSVFILFICSFNLQAQPISLPNSSHSFIVIAHRGEHNEVAENTIASIKQAIKSKVDYVELDLRTTKDSVLVIIHDATVNKMTNGTGQISDLTYAEIKQLKVFDKTKGSSKIYSIPTFIEVLKTCRKKINIYLDFKNASVDQAYETIKNYKMEKQVIVYINEASQYTDWKKIAPEMPLMLSLPDDVKTKEDLKKFLLQTPVALLDGSYSDYTPAVLEAATEAGIPAWPDIQSNTEANNWDKAILMGFKGLQTDHPKALIEYLKNKGLR